MAQPPDPEHYAQSGRDTLYEKKASNYTSVVTYYEFSYLNLINEYRIWSEVPKLYVQVFQALHMNILDKNPMCGIYIFYSIEFLIIFC